MASEATLGADEGVARLLRMARSADPGTRIDYRDPIAAFGVAAIAPVAAWLADDVLGHFAVRTLATIGDQGQRESVIAALESVGISAAPAVKQGVAEELSRQRHLADAEKSQSRDRVVVPLHASAAPYFAAMATAFQPKNSSDQAARVNSALVWLAERLRGTDKRPSLMYAAWMVARVDRANGVRAAYGLPALSGSERRAEAEDAVRNLLAPQAYRRFCWNCGQSLNSILNPRCHRCSLYYCTCGACSRGCAEDHPFVGYVAADN